VTMVFNDSHHHTPAFSSLGFAVKSALFRASESVGGRGWIVADEHVYVDDGISGAEFANRPGFLRLMNVLKPRPTHHKHTRVEPSVRPRCGSLSTGRRTMNDYRVAVWTVRPTSRAEGACRLDGVAAGVMGRPYDVISRNVRMLCRKSR
jgi:hypothetical protein